MRPGDPDDPDRVRDEDPAIRLADDSPYADEPAVGPPLGSFAG